MSTAEQSFLTAFRNTNRRAQNQWLQTQGVDRDDAAAAEAAKQQWQRLPHLSDPLLREFARTVLAVAAGAPLGAEAPFPATIWYNGATDTYGGHRFKGTVGQFVEHVLVARSTEVAEKRKGWVVTPTTCVDGHRVNTSTTAMHAVNLDCDGRGEWDQLLDALDDLDIGYIAYQSGGWTAETPKWHILLPLAEPFDTSSPDKIAAWKIAYNSVRVLVGALAELPGEGFDPTVETPTIPVFITERRSPDAPTRRVVWQSGRALDMTKLTAALPPIPVEVAPPRAVHGTVATVALDDIKLESIVIALSGALGKILSTRRDLFMAVDGALLDRGVDPDSVRAIIEEVSHRCPGDPAYTEREVEDRHKQHVHDCETTIAKWEKGETFTRIGTVQGGWPEVARAIDSVLPDAATAAHLDRLSRPRGAQLASVPADGAAPSAPADEPRSATVNLGKLTAQLARLRTKKLRSSDFHEKVRGVILGALLDGQDLVPLADGAPVPNAKGRDIDRDEAIAMAMGMLAFKLDPSTPFTAIVEIVRPALGAMVQEGETMLQLLDKAKLAFAKALSNRDKLQAKNEQEHEERVALRRKLGGIG